MTILSTILYASWNGTAWNTQMVVSNISFNSMNLALDSHDYPHIITSTGTYASWTGKAWSIQIATPDFSANKPCYLAIDSKGNPHISYLIGSPTVITSLMYATATESTQTPSPTQNSPTPVSALPLLLVLTAVIIGTVVTLVVYVWKKKTQKIPNLISSIIPSFKNCKSRNFDKYLLC